MRIPSITLAVLACSFAVPRASMPADAQPAPRTAVPIREVLVRPIGTPRYVVTLIVNGVPLETGLDTGSVGLRILPKTVKQTAISTDGALNRYSYGSGIELSGHRASAAVRLGAIVGTATLQAIDRVSCVPGRQCPAANVSPDAYGLMGSGEPGQGFQAIMGVRLAPGDIPNTLVALGVRRWIVHLPQRGQGDGVLVLNPDESDLVGFKSLRRSDGAPGTIAACVMVARPDARRVCGPTLLDTGQPQLLVQGGERPPAWQRGVEARLEFPAGKPGAAGVLFRTGDALIGSETNFVPSSGTGRISMNAGRLPFYAYDVLYDAEHGTIAIRPNGEATSATRAVSR